MTRSKACLYGLEEEEVASNEDTAHEGEKTNDEIDRFTLEPKDMEVLPIQP